MCGLAYVRNTFKALELNGRAVLCRRGDADDKGNVLMCVLFAHDLSIEIGPFRDFRHNNVG